MTSTQMGVGTQPEAEELLTLQMAADAYPALGLRYFRGLIENRQIPYSKPTNGRVLLRRSDIENLINRNWRDAIGAA